MGVPKSPRSNDSFSRCFGVLNQKSKEAEKKFENGTPHSKVFKFAKPKTRRPLLFFDFLASFEMHFLTQKEAGAGVFFFDSSGARSNNRGEQKFPQLPSISLIGTLPKRREKSESRALFLVHFEYFTMEKGRKGSFFPIFFDRAPIVKYSKWTTSFSLPGLFWSKKRGGR